MFSRETKLCDPLTTDPKPFAPLVTFSRAQHYILYPPRNTGVGAGLPLGDAPSAPLLGGRVLDRGASVSRGGEDWWIEGAGTAGGAGEGWWIEQGRDGEGRDD